MPKKYFDLYPEESIKLPPFLETDLGDIPGAKPNDEHLQIVEQGMWKKAIRAYLACITYADAQVGRVLDALDKSPAGTNTIVAVDNVGAGIGEMVMFCQGSSARLSASFICSLPLSSV